MVAAVVFIVTVEADAGVDVILEEVAQTMCYTKHYTCLECLVGDYLPGYFISSSSSSILSKLRLFYTSSFTNSAIDTTDLNQSFDANYDSYDS